MIGISIANSLGLKLSGINPDAAAFIAAAGITNTTEIDAVNALVNGLQADGLWSKMKAVYPFVTDNRNLLGYTEDFGNAYWLKGSVSIISNSTTAPNGTTTADTLVENTANTFKYISSSQINVVSGVSYTASIYAKSTNRYLQITFDSAAFGSGQYANFDLINGVLGTTLGGSATITSVGSGWYLCTFTATAIASVSNNVYYSLQNSASATRAASYLGDGTSSIFLWGSQFETGSLTTYQPIATSQQAYIASQFKYNLKDPRDLDAAFRLVFNGGWTHSSTGATPNGTNGYADTKLNASTVLTKTNHHISYYGRTQTNSGNTWDMGSQNSPNDSLLSLYFAGVSLKGFLSGAFPTNFASNSSTNTLGLHIGSQTSSTSSKLYQNTSLLTTNNNSNLTSFANVNMYLGAANIVGVGGGNYSSRQTAFSTIGDGLTDTDATNLYTRVQAFQTSLSRQV